ncbi:MAG: polysaccharide biosynthesis/export family protein [Pseudomonadota bacterium]
MNYFQSFAIALASLAFYSFSFADSGSDYRLDSGDQVKVTVFGHEDLSGAFEIDGSGRIAMPLIRYVQAKDLTATELEQSITDKLKPDYLKDPKVSVEIQSNRPFYIIGEVNVPGSYSYVNGMSVVTAVAVAGGFTYRANKDEMIITRQENDEKIKLEVGLDDTVKPGDIIEIKERFF